MMNKLKLMAIAIAMYFGLIGLVSANSTYISPDWVLEDGEFGLIFGSPVIGSTPFSNDFDFTMPVSHFGGGAVVISGFNGSFTTLFDHFSLTDITTSTLIASDSGLPSPIAMFEIPLGTYSMTDTFRLHVDGHLLSGVHAGSYSGSMLLSPAPEPESYAMFIAGLGLMGLLARRRKNGKV